MDKSDDKDLADVEKTCSNNTSHNKDNSLIAIDVDKIFHQTRQDVLRQERQQGGELINTRSTRQSPALNVGESQHKINKVVPQRNDVSLDECDSKRNSLDVRFHAGQSNSNAAKDIDPVKRERNQLAKDNHQVRISPKKKQELFIRQKLLDRRSSAEFNNYDDNLLRRTLADAGRWAYGIRLVELWVMNENNTMLFRPEHGWWIDPVYHRNCGGSDNNCQLCRLFDESRKDYVPPIPLAPGEGLPGVLWSEARGAFLSSAGSFREKLHAKSRNLISDAPSNTNTSNRTRVVWREVKAIADDPDQPWNPRLQVLGSLGLGWTAAVPFSLHDQKGIIVYMARDGVDLKRLQSTDNETYLTAAADLAGAAYAFRNPRRLVVKARRSELDNVLRRVRIKLLFMIHLGMRLDDLVQEEEAKNAGVNRAEKLQNVDGFSENLLQQKLKHFRSKLKTTLQKCRGAGIHPPPAFSWNQTLLTFTGVLITISIVSYFNEFILGEFGSDYAIPLGPFGALMALLYGLTAAPASQPRNIIYGQALSMMVAIGFSYLKFLPSAMRGALATAIAIAAMVKVGIIHPPAGASAIIFATGDYRWESFLFLTIANLIAIGTATLINNWSNKRQYPNCWGFYI